MSSHSRCLYIDVTGDLHGRVWELKNGIYKGLTQKYLVQPRGSGSSKLAR